jgi:hypothetical protein
LPCCTSFVQRVADHGQHVEVLAAGQALRDGVLGLAHGGAELEDDLVAGLALELDGRGLVGLGKAVRADDLDLGGLQRRREEERRREESVAKQPAHATVSRARTRAAASR